MDYAYFTALMEECHRFMERPFTRVPEQELAGNRALLLQYTDVLHSVFERYGTKRDGGMTALGFEIYEALSIVTRYRERLFGDDREQTWGLSGYAPWAPVRRPCFLQAQGAPPDGERAKRRSCGHDKRRFALTFAAPEQRTRLGKIADMASVQPFAGKGSFGGRTGRKKMEKQGVR